LKIGSRAPAAAAWVLSVFATATLAQPIPEAEEALRKRDAARAIRILEQAAATGDVAAKGRLANYLLNLPPPHRDAERACTLAREASDDGDAAGAVTRADCLLTRVEKAEQPFALARDLARKAHKAGLPAGGFTLYRVYTMDPQYGYMQDGKPDMARYRALAAMPVSARGEQLEAFDGLADAVRAGHLQAAVLALAYLLDSSAPGNIDRVLGLAGILQQNGAQIPQQLLGGVRIAQEVKRLGTTHASATAFRNAHQSALLAAIAEIRGPAESTPCDIKEIKLTEVRAEAVKDAEYLPISNMPLTNSYLVRGSWNEAWTFNGCQRTAVVPMTFNADGWSGAHFGAKYSPKPRAR
jgi:hypothetical protein